jgi:hypothetical protein
MGVIAADGRATRTSRTRWPQRGKSLAHEMPIGVQEAIRENSASGLASWQALPSPMDFRINQEMLSVSGTRIRR